VPLHRLEFITRNQTSDEECLSRLQSLLLGTAGLLPSQRQDRYQKNRIDDNWIYKLERLWTSYHPAEAMTQDEWNLFRVRPNNSPIRRIAAMSYLMLRYRQKGLFNGVINMITETPLSQSPARLAKGLLVTTNGYWASHLDFGLASRTKSPTLLGSGRASDITINVLLPFTFAWSKLTPLPGLKKKALALYRRYPRLAVNTIERHMKNQLGISNSLVNSARRQQGLIHIYNTLCTQGRCHSCPLSHLEAGNDVQV
jgi:hypothetical protein